MATREKRKPDRIPDHDYTQAAQYYITFNTANNVQWLGEIKNGEIHLNQNGKIANQQWQWLAKQYDYVKLDEYIIMPDHVHAIIKIEKTNENTKPKSLSSLIGAFKTTSSKLIRQNGTPQFKWHRSFHDRIIRDNYSYRNEHYESLERIRQYIKNNPKNWKK